MAKDESVKKAVDTFNEDLNALEEFDDSTRYEPEVNLMDIINNLADIWTTQNGQNITSTLRSFARDKVNSSRTEYNEGILVFKYTKMYYYEKENYKME